MASTVHDSDSVSVKINKKGKILSKTEEMWRGRRPGIESLRVFYSTVEIFDRRRRGRSLAALRSRSESSRSSPFACSTSSTARPRNTLKNTSTTATTKCDSLAAELEHGPSQLQLLMRVRPYRDTQLSTSKRQQHAHELNTTLSQTVLERRLVETEITCIELETFLHERTIMVC